MLPTGMCAPEPVGRGTKLSCPVRLMPIFMGINVSMISFQTSNLIEQMKELEVQHMEEKEGFLTRIAELEEVNAMKLETIESAENARDTLQLKLNSQEVQYNKEKDALHSIISNLESEQRLLVASMSNIRGERDDLELKITSMQQDLDSIEGLETKTRDLEVSNENLLAEIDQLKAELENAKTNHNEELMKLIGEMNETQQSNTELKGMNKDLAKQISKQQQLLNVHQVRYCTKSSTISIVLI